MSKAKFLSGALILAASFTAPAWWWVAMWRTTPLLKPTRARTAARDSMAKKRLTYRHPYSACVIGVVRAAE
jgi:hypothetical protein